MRLTIVLGLLILANACSSFRKEPIPVKETPVVTEKKEKRVTTPVKKAESRSKTSQAVWHLIYPSQVEFALVHKETGKQEQIAVETTLSHLDLLSGTYTIEGLYVGGEKFDYLEGQELFEFEIKKNAPTYIGSFVVECPKVGTLHFSELRRMKFFNRLNFTGQSGTCEMIVGNDLANVRRAWSKLEKKPGSKLLPGF